MYDRRAVNGDAPSVQTLHMNEESADRMVIAYHLIMTTYGFWLPNDPRGSGSKEVRAEHLKRFGPATHTNSKRSVAHRKHDWNIRVEAKKNLRYPPVLLNGLQAISIARGFQYYIQKSRVLCYACTILPTHVHLVIHRHRLSIERIAILLKGAATAQLLADNRHPFKHLKLNRLPTPWTRNERNIFLNDPAGIQRSFNYADTNARRAKIWLQRWPFLTPLPLA